ncbi:MAG TPA: MBL fold metallo-hydrolase [Candidatus Methylomirabilis sp.]|jgi:L-ascorbate metabolism protein UlaG (beta-lactamase superfamily)|nr:MBL fold metallo-hydrolase [Candidatus Methylomirabilis sp.]
MEYGGILIEWTGHDGFRLAGTRTVYIDPYRLDPKKQWPAGDYCFVTHDHHDHCSPEDLLRVVAPDRTVLLASRGAHEKVKGQVPAKQTRVLAPGESLSLEGLTVRAIPAYNLTKFRAPGVPFHPKDAGGVGLVITLDGVTVFHAGDTDLTDEIRGLHGVDVALLPVSGTYVMTAEEAAEACRVLKPKVAIPMHYGAIVGSAEDARRFKALLPDHCVEILAAT